MIDLSIVIPHYNSINSLIKLLDTIPIKENIQIIVIDDKSVEKVKELNSIINNKRYKHITFLKNNTSNKGAGTCRNIGLKNAKGKWMLFADADDFFVKGFYDEISKYFHCDYDVVFFTPTSIEIDTGNKSDRHLKYEKLINNYINKKDLESEMLLRYQFYVPWSKLIRKKFLDETNIIFDEVIASNDVMFSTKLGYYMKDFDVTTDIIYCVTRGAGTLTTNTNIKIYDSRLEVHINYCRFLKEKLDSRNYKTLKLNGMGMLFNAIKFKFGLRKAFLVYLQLRRNKVAVFDLKFINPFFTFKKLIQHYNRHIKQKRYLSNNKR